jgi:hypothetical protein
MQQVSNSRFSLFESCVHRRDLRYRLMSASDRIRDYGNSTSVGFLCLKNGNYWPVFTVADANNQGGSRGR